MIKVFNPTMTVWTFVVTDYMYVHSYTEKGAIGNSGNGNRKWKMETVKT